MDEEILQDFLVEAAELIEQLNDQLMELENSPEDTDLLNAVFRSFHTIKGGAGFIGVTPLVNVCHRAENIFDKIRNQELAYDANVADVILKAYDRISQYMQELQQGVREFASGDEELLAGLDAIVGGHGHAHEDVSTQVEASPASVEESQTVSEVKLELPPGVDPDGDITDDEFEALLNQRDTILSSHSASQPAAQPQLSLPPGVDPDGDISDEEFEALLNQRDLFEGKDVAPTPVAIATSAPTHAKPAVAPAPAKVASPSPKPAHDEDNGKKGGGAAAQAESTLRVDTRRLDDIMNLVGELVLVRNRLLSLRSKFEDEEINIVVGNLDHVTTDLQASVMKTRMQPVKKVFGRFPRVVRDLARKLGKEIELELVGEDTDLDKNLVEALADPLVHLVRNSVDHGIEMPDVRLARAKPKQGTIVLEAKQEGDHILLSITDDGAGMDPEKLKAIAIKKGILDELTASQMDNRTAYELIMAPGFSTKTEISDISGRGVGMDVVKNMITKLNGSIEILSELGQGTKMNIRVPLTLAILPTLMVGVGKYNYAIPLTSVQEIFDFDPDQVNKIDGKSMIRLRKKSIRLYFLDQWLVPDKLESHYEDAKVVIVNIGGDLVGVIVDQVRGQEEVVIKPLGVMLQGIAGYAGATITGDGEIALILDLPSMVHRFQYLF